MRFEDVNIMVNYSGSNQQVVRCPECTPHRKKQNSKDLSVNISEEVWNCHHCGWSGGLNVKKEQITVKKVYTKPAYRKPVVRDETAIYLEERGISVESQLKYQISCESVWMPQTQKDENCIVFNYFIDGELINRKYRDAKKNMKMEKDCRLVMYNPVKENKQKEVETIYITEGEIDCLTLLECGYTNVLSVPNGAPAENTDISNIEIPYLQTIDEIFVGYKKVILVMDSDKVGERFRDEIARRIGYEKTSRVHYPEGCKDINDVLVKHDVKGVSECMKNAKEYPVKGLHAAEYFTEQVLDYFENGFEKGVQTGWMDVDKIYTPRRREFTVLTGMPGSGKSVWLDNLMVNIAAKEKWKFLVFSPENAPCERHIANLAEIIVGKPFDSQYNGFMKKSELIQAQEIINKHFYFIMPENDGFTIDGILKLAKTSVFRYGVKGVVIDPWNEIDHNRDQLSETDYISKALTKTRNFSRINNVHTWIVAHPTKLQKDKQGNYPPPTPYDISGSSNWRNKADHCVCVHRDYINKTTSVLSQKVRFKECGKVGDAMLKFDISCNRFDELTASEKRELQNDDD